ncbi:hypothetical protein, partial [Pantoea sp. 18069]|uniref:hypothetical protein n=1 Tax=Pantoea sp. 18069 TaxID=2681415 RepID=UPI001F40017C
LSSEALHCSPVFQPFPKEGSTFPFRFQPAVAGSAVFEAECKCSTRQNPWPQFFIIFSHSALPLSKKSRRPAGAGFCRGSRAPIQWP